MTMMRRFVNNKYQNIIFPTRSYITTGCGFWWTYPQMAIGAILSIIATTMQLIYRDIKSEKKYDKFWSIGIIVFDIILAIWSFYHWNVPIVRV